MDGNKNHDHNNGRFISGSNGSTASVKHGEEKKHFDDMLKPDSPLPGKAKKGKRGHETHSIRNMEPSSNPKKEAYHYLTHFHLALRRAGFNRINIKCKNGTNIRYYENPNGMKANLSIRSPSQSGKNTPDTMWTIDLKYPNLENKVKNGNIKMKFGKKKDE